MQRIRDDVRGGASLSQALDTAGGVFSRFYVNIVRAGEAGGALSAVMLRLAEFMERAKELRETIRSALIYPALLLIVAVSSVMLLLIKVVPQFEPIFAQSGKALPLATQMVINAGRFAQNYVVDDRSSASSSSATGGAGRCGGKSSRYKWDRRFLKLPIFGDLINKIETARFARTLSTLLGNGVTLLGGMSIVRETMTNSVLAGALDSVIVKLREGRGLAQPLRETGVYPQLAIQLIQVGEETGRLEEMLGRVADIYDVESSRAVKRMLGVLEPLLILVMAGHDRHGDPFDPAGHLQHQRSRVDVMTRRCIPGDSATHGEQMKTDHKTQDIDHAMHVGAARLQPARAAGRAAAPRRLCRHLRAEDLRPGRKGEAQRGEAGDRPDRAGARPVQARDRPLSDVAGRPRGAGHRAFRHDELERPVSEALVGAEGSVEQRVQVCLAGRPEPSVRHHLARRRRQGRRRRGRQGHHQLAVTAHPCGYGVGSGKSAVRVRVSMPFGRAACRGFTMLELMVVLVILMIAYSLASPVIW